MRTSKSLVALLLVLCMAMTFVVPMAFAETLTLNYQFGNDTAGNVTGYPAEEISYWNDSTTIKNGTVTVPTDAELGLSRSSYLGKNQARYASIVHNGDSDGSRQTDFRFNGTGAWGAIKIYGVKAGTYTMKIKYTAAADVTFYVMTGNEYNAALADYMTDLKALTGTTSTQVAGDAQFLGNYTAVGTLNTTSTQLEDVTPDVVFENDGSEVGEYVLVFRNSAGSNSLKLRRMTMVGELAAPAVPEVTDPAVTVAGVKYATAAEALTAIASAAAGTDVEIHKDLTLAADLTTAANLVIGEGVTVDVAGYNLTAGTIGVSGKLIDTAATPGLVTGSVVITGTNDGYLPLTDGTGYRLYKFTVAAEGCKTINADTAKFGFHVEIENNSGYALAASCLKMSVAMSWTGGEATASTEGSDFANTWATAVAADETLDVIVTVTGLTGIEGFSLTPSITVNGVTMSMSAIAQA